jgi:hypothetical protein
VRVLIDNRLILSPLSQAPPGVVMVVLDCRSESGQMAFTIIKIMGQLDRQEVYDPGFLP